MLIFLCSLTLTSIHDYWKNHSSDYRDLCPQINVSDFLYADYFCHSFSSKEQTSFHYMAAVIIHSDFEAHENIVCHCFLCFPSICHKVMWLDAVIFIFWMLSFKPASSLSSFTFIKRLFSFFPQALKNICQVCEWSRASSNTKNSAEREQSWNKQSQNSRNPEQLHI